ncbi:hypothetical protein [Thermoactinomyces mirandus]|uniref:hypothetical protein n=1 Tax=Thermoactinomyces mirandus TaxID=2756294 RepID=UPI0015EE5755|nr:hypothetical protein [Thermoactinomyces mirandus]
MMDNKFRTDPDFHMTVLLPYRRLTAIVFIWDVRNPVKISKRMSQTSDEGEICRWPSDRETLHRLAGKRDTQDPQGSVYSQIPRSIWAELRVGFTPLNRRDLFGKTEILDIVFKLSLTALAVLPWRRSTFK